MNISQKGIDLIKEFEGCRTVAYLDAVGVWTVGYGTTNADKSITGVEIRKGLTITKTVAENWLKLSLNKKYTPKVEKYNNKYHFNQNQFDALVSFAYNIGSIDQLTQNGTRTIKEISEKILAYDKAGGKVLAGLTRRRQAEKKLFDTPVEVEEKPKKTTYKGTFPTLPTRGYFDKYDRGEQARLLQLLLNWITNDNIEVDGYIGEESLNCVGHAQKILGFKNKEVDCLWGAKTQKKAKTFKK